MGSLNFVASDVLSYLNHLKRYGCRGQTSGEIKFHFWGVISERSIESQLERLKKGKYVREVKLKYKNKEIILYEPND